MTIHCIFSIQNQYHQPNNDLVGWFSYSPSLIDLSDLLPGYDPNFLNELVSKRYCKGVGGVEYRIQEVKEGELLK